MKASPRFSLLLLSLLTTAILTTEARSQAAITSIRRTGTNVEIKFKGTAGTAYRIERSPAMAAGSWTDTGHALNGTGAEQTIVLTAAAVAGREFFRLIAPAPAIPGFIYLPAGSFLMGDQSTTNPQDGAPNERPVIEVPVAGFYLKTTEVTRDEWDATKTFATGAGYTFSSNAGAGKDGNHPVHSVNWYDVVKWCNARSEQDSLEPCYYIADGISVYRTGAPSTIKWNFTKNGYRLPAESEWEKAARGGLSATRFPWGATITHSQANYKSSSTFPYDNSPTTGFHPVYSDPPVLPYTSPVGSFPANGYGLFDMSGNVSEYCWDFITSNYSNGYLIRSESASSLFQRVTRGADWSSDSYALRCAYRGTRFPDTGKGNYLGFRLARGRLN